MVKNTTINEVKVCRVFYDTDGKHQTLHTFRYVKARSTKNFIKERAAEEFGGNPDEYTILSRRTVSFTVQITPEVLEQLALEQYQGEI